MDTRVLYVQLNRTRQCFKVKKYQEAKTLCDKLSEWSMEKNISYDVLAELVNELITDGKYIRAFIVLKCQRNLIEEHCISKLEVIAWKLKYIFKILLQGKRRYMCLNCILPELCEILSIMKEKTQLDFSNEVLCLSKCMMYTALCYSKTGQWMKSKEIYSEACELLEKQLGTEASKYRIYGYCLNNLGTACKYLKLETPKTYWEKALAAYNEARDWTNKEKFELCIDKTKKNIKINMNK